MSDVEKIIRQIRAHEQAHAEELKRLRTLSMEERSAMLVACCRGAVAIMKSRAEAGLPPRKPTPWPDTTWELFRRHAPNARSEPTHA
jgi:hypothetical protein